MHQVRIPVVVAPMTADPATLADDALASLIADGDEGAFGAVYDRYADILYGSVVRFMRDREAAEEVVQDAYLALWRHADRYLPSAGSLLGWLLRIARNKAIDRTRMAARRPRAAVDRRDEDGLPDGLERALAAGAIASGTDVEAPDQAVTREWTRAVVRTALSAMPDVERHALELAYDEGLTQAEIARRLGWPLGTVKTRTRRGLAMLRSALEGVPELVDVPATGATLGSRPADRPRGGDDGPR